MHELLGWKVKDKISGFTGVVDKVTWYVNGCVQAVIQPTGKSGKKVPEAESIDVQQLSKVGTKAVVKPIPIVNKKEFDMVEIVKDELTGFGGKIVGRCEMLDGTMRFAYQVPCKIGDTIKTYWQDSEFLVSKSKKGAKAAAKEPAKGGPQSFSCPKSLI